MKFVRIDPKYLDALALVDTKVQSNSSLLGKDNKPFLGVLFIQGNYEYFVPLSSPKPKHYKMNNSKDFHKITVMEKGKIKLLSVLNFNNMVPVTSNFYTLLNITADKDRFLLQKEWNFCRSKFAILAAKAHSLYEQFKKGELKPNEAARTVNFTLLEEELKKMLAVLNQSQSNTTATNSTSTPTAKVPATVGAAVSQPADAASASGTPQSNNAASQPNPTTAQSAVSAAASSMFGNMPTVQAQNPQSIHTKQNKNDDINE